MIQKFADGIGDPLLLLDQLFGSLSAYFVFTFDYTQSVGFTAVIRGGRYSSNTYPDTTLTLAPSSTTYVEADTSAHTIVSNTTGYSGGTKKPIGVATTNADGRTNWDQDFTVATT